jgi:WD40 repeat protein/serine/threonine protein kinase
VIRALEEYLAALEKGCRPDRQEFLAHHATIAPVLAGCLDGLEFMQTANPERQLADSGGSAAILHPTAPLGDFCLLREVGRGGMGFVYEAEQMSLGRRVALKVLPFAAALDARQLQRFKNEAQAAAHLHHTNIVPVFGVGCERGVHFYAMQYIDGQTLAAVIRELNRNVEGRITNDERMSNDQAPSLKPPAPGAEALTDLRHSTLDILSSFGIGHSSFCRTVANLGIQAAEALEHAHQFGVVHRDIKPANLLVDGRGHLWVTDFGLAHCQSQAGLTMTGDLVGTLRYMSPEQALAKRPLIDHRTDIYSLGVTLYELLTLEPAFSGSDREELLQQIAFEEPPPPRKKNRAIPRELETIVLKAMAKSPEDRYATAQELTEDLRRFLEYKPIRAKRPTSVQRAVKWCRRNPLLAGALTAVVGSLVLGTVVACLLAAWALAEAAQATRQAYAANLRLMHLAWDSHNMLELHQLLGQTAGFPERGFEWYYWQRLSHVEHVTLLGHIGGVTSVTFAPDGRRLATGGKDGTARIWNADSGQELLCLRGHRSEVTAVAFAPDGRWLVTGSTDGTAKLWDLSTRRRLRTLEGLNTGSVWAVAVTADGQRVVTGSEDGTARVWDAAGGREVVVLDGRLALSEITASTAGLLSSPLVAASALYPTRTGHVGPIWAVAVTPDGKRAVTAGQDCMVMTWDADTGRQLRSFVGNFFIDWGINSVCVTSDGKRLITAGNDNNARVWDMDTGKELLALSTSTGWVMSVAVTPDGQRLVTGHSSGPVIVWDLASGRQMMTLMGHRAFVTCVAVSPDGKRVATASMDGTARVWDISARSDRIHAIPPPDRMNAVTTSGRGTLTIHGHTGTVWSVAVTPDGKRIVSGSSDRTARVWDMVSGQQLLKLEGHTDEISSVAVTPDGQRIITAGADKTDRIWDAVSGRQLAAINDPRRVRTISLTPDGRRLVTGGTVVAHFWDVASRSELLPPFRGPMSIISGLAVTPDGRRVVMGCWDGTIRLFDIPSRHELLKLQESSAGVSSIAVMPDSRRLIVGRGDGTATVWDMATAQELFCLNGHTDRVASIVVTPKGKQIITGSVDGTVRVWDAQSGLEVLTFDGQAGPVRSVAVTASGRRIVTGNNDGTVKIWEAASPEQSLLWARQDQEVERRWGAWQQPSPKALEFIQDWLVLGPVLLNDDRTGAQWLEDQQLAAEADLHPRAQDHVLVGAKEYTWQAHRWEEPVLGFDRQSEKYTIDGVAYAGCYVVSTAERNDLWLQVGSQNLVKVDLNGQEVYRHTRGNTMAALDPVGPVRLRKGTNVLLLKVVTLDEGWRACARFVDPEGNPVHGLKAQLTPD